MEISKSRILYDVLDKIGASETIRQLYKETARSFEILKDIGYNQGMGVTYNFGSHSEGTTTPGLQSDFDSLLWCDIIPIILKLKDAPERGFAALLIQDKNTAPGYVKLQCIRNGSAVPYMPKFETDGVGLVKRDRRGICCWQDISQKCTHDSYFRTVIHGPSTTEFDPLSAPMDNVFSLRCRKLPSFAKEWFKRKRHYSWPERHIIDQCYKLGFFVVKTGHPNSKEQDIEWRISFSLQERLLMFNLTEVQHKCYIMLKLIMRDLVVGKIGESISSYHCKTCLLYTIEQNSQCIWYPENIFPCVIKCLKRLLNWTKKGHCPNYFIRDENMFVGKVEREIRKQVISILEDILAEGESFIHRIETDSIGKYFIQHVQRNDNYEMNIFENTSHQVIGGITYKLQSTNIQNAFMSASFLIYSEICQSDIHPKTKDGQLSSNILHAIERHCELIRWLRNTKSIAEYSVAETKEAIQLLFPFLYSSLAGHLLSISLQCDDYLQRKRYLCSSFKMFQKGISSDVASGRLRYITYLYIRGKNHLCKEELTSLEQRFKSPVISVSPFGNNERSIINNDLQIELQKFNYTTKYLLQNHVCADVIFIPTEEAIVPPALRFEMFRSAGTVPEPRFNRLNFWHNWVVVDSKVYMYFMWYLLAGRFHVSLDERISIIMKLQSVADTYCLHLETAYNLLAWVFMQERLIPQAIKYLVFSWNDFRQNDRGYEIIYNSRRIQRNAAKWLMLLLIQKIWFPVNSSDIVNHDFSFCFKCFEYISVQLQTCSSCKVAQYCSRYCQNNDWNIHKQICKNIK